MMNLADRFFWTPWERAAWRKRRPTYWGTSNQGFWRKERAARKARNRMARISRRENRA